MSHCVHAIVAPESFADAILAAWPELPVLRHKSHFCIFPVDYELIDAKIEPETTPRETGDEFMLLTPAFENYLRELSRGGVLAYVETDYFGGVGGQGAIVFRDGSEVMRPKWHDSGAINTALEMIGVPRSLAGDRFSMVGLDDVRHNEDVLDKIAAQNGG